MNSFPENLLKSVLIPPVSDRFVRLKTLEEILYELDEELQVKNGGPSGGYDLYLIAMPSASQKAAIKENNSVAPADPVPPAPESIYVTGGELNGPYLLKNADLLFENGDYQLARNIYQSLLKSRVEIPKCHSRLASISEKLGNWEEAKNHWEEAIAFDPNPDWQERLAQCLTRLGKHSNASEVLERTLRISGLSPGKRFRLHKLAALSWLKTEQPQLAHLHLDECVKFGGSIEEKRDFSLLQASLALKVKRPEIAKLEFQKVLAADPEHPAALLGLAQALSILNDKRGAHDAYAKLLEKDQKNAAAIVQLVKLAFDLKSYASAVRLLETFLGLTGSKEANLLFSLGTMQFHLGRQDDCQRTLGVLAKAHPGHRGVNELMTLSRRTDGSRQGSTQGTHGGRATGIGGSPAG